MATPRPETLSRLTDIVFDKVMSVLRTPDAGSYELFSEYLDRLDRELDAPLRLSAATPESTVLKIRSNLTTAGDLGGKTVPPIDDVLNVFEDSEIDFSGGATTGGTITTEGGVFSLPTVTVGEFTRMVAVYQSANNAVDCLFADPSTTVSGLTNPGDLFSSLDGLPVGYLDLESTGVSSFASPGDSLIKNFVGSDPTIFRFAAGGGIGGGALNDFKVKSLSSNMAIIGKGFQKLSNGLVLVTGSGTTSASLPENLTVNLDTILGASAVADTTYWLYVDLQNLENPPFTLTDSGRKVVRVSTESHFALLTTSPDETNPLRYLPVGFVHTADDASWDGSESVFGTTPVLRETLDNRFFNLVQSFSTEVDAASGSITVAHGLSAKPDIVEFTYFDGTNEYPANDSSHVLNITDSDIEYSSLGLSFGSGEKLMLKAFYITRPASNISLPTTQPEFGWYTDTSVSSVSHNLNDALDIKGMSLIEYDASADRYQVLDATNLVDNFDDTTIYYDWGSLSPSATLQYRLVVGGRTLPSAIPTQFGGFNKFVGLGPGSYPTVASAMADCLPGDSILVSQGYTISAEETIDCSDIKIGFMPGVEIEVDGGSVGWRITADRVRIVGLNFNLTKVGTITDALRVEGDDCNIKDLYLEANDAGLTVTNGVNLVSTSERCQVYGSAKAIAGSFTDISIDDGKFNDLEMRHLQPFVETIDSAEHDVTIKSGRTRQHPFLTVASGVTYTVDGRLISMGGITADGDLIDNGDVYDIDI